MKRPTWDPWECFLNVFLIYVWVAFVYLAFIG